MSLLAVSDESEREVWRELGVCNIHVSTAEKGMALPEVAGILVTRRSDMEELNRANLARIRSPRLLLVYGAQIPYGWAETLVDTYASNGEWDVVRLTLFSDGERALIGGDPNSLWTRALCRRLADHQILSMVFGMREVDEAIRQLPRYLAWKERFFFELGGMCDSQGVSLQRVARALGMDKRVGQGWLYPERKDHTQVCQWIERECRHVLEKANVHRVVLWGQLSIWRQMDTGWLAEKEVCLYTGTDEPFPNESLSGWSMCSTWQKALENADLLVIAQAGGVIKELSLTELVRCMKQAIVVDAAACFPLSEAQANLICYRAIGEKTNVWE